MYSSGSQEETIMGNDMVWNKDICDIIGTICSYKVKRLTTLGHGMVWNKESYGKHGEISVNK